MNNKKNMVIWAAAKEAGVTEKEMKDIIITYKDGFYEIEFSTEWMLYDMFVEYDSMEVMGIDYRPVPVNTLLASLPESGQDAS